MAGFPKAGDEYGGRYRIVREIGHGGMGIVYEAIDAVLNRSIALKIVLPSLPDREDYQARFAREASALAKIRSRHIVGIHEYGEHEDTVYFVTELFPDGDLQRWLATHGPLDRRASLLLVAQICEALADAHASGVIHRDVKPGNVLLWNRSEGLIPYLADFGIAVDGQQGLTRTGALVGSPAYMAPERHFGHPADERGDVYSLGCLLWAVLTGDAPYAGTDFQMMNSHINEPTPHLGTGHPVDARINEVLAGTMQKNPELRIATADEVRARLLAIVREVDGQGAPTGPPLPPLPPAGVPGAGPTTGEQDAPGDPDADRDHDQGTRMVPRATPVPVADDSASSDSPGDSPGDDAPSPAAAAVAAVGVGHATTIRDAVPPTPPAPASATTGGPAAPVAPGPHDEGDGDRGRRRAWLVGAAAVALLVGTVATAVGMAGGGDDPAGTTTADPTSSGPTDEASVAPAPPPAPGAPKVRASEGYRSVSFAVSPPRYRADGEVRVEVDTGRGWQPARRPVRVETEVGGAQACARFRSVATGVDGTESPGEAVRECGRAEPPTVRFIRTDDPCVNSIGGPCTWYDVAVTGFRSGTDPVVNVRRASGDPWCVGCDYDRIEVGDDGRGYLRHDWKISRDEGQVILDVAGVTGEFRVYY